MLLTSFFSSPHIFSKLDCVLGVQNTNSNLKNTMPKAKSSNSRRKDPLHKSIEEGRGHLRSVSKARTKRQGKDKDDDDAQDVLDSKSTRKILQIAREQQQEIEAEEREEAVKHGVRQPLSEIQESDDDEQNFSDAAQDELDYGDIDWDQVPEDADPQDLEIFSRYLQEQRANEGWTDKLMSRVNQIGTTNQAEFGTGDKKMVDGGEKEGVMLPPKVIQVYTQIGALLSRYRSGKLPRAFKIVPTLKNWRDIIYVTEPEQWSSQAMYEATKLFIAGMPTHQVHKFVKEVLLPAFREQVHNDKAVDYHMFRALKKALFKPQAFFKGLLFPLLSEMEPTNREAIILGSVLSKTSIPVLHSAAAILFIAEMPYSTANTIIIKILIDKKYALPYKVVDGLVFHYTRFRTHPDPLPLVWHQSFLIFCQRYKNDITDDQRDSLMAVARLQPHHGISPEIRRELLAGEPRMA